MQQIEVFKTDVTCREQANRLIGQIHETFAGFKANFDLDDCDRVLRVVSHMDDIQAIQLIHCLKHWGCIAEILPD